MTTCPICSCPMLAIKWRRPTVYCSRACHCRANAALARAHQAEVDEAAVLRLVSGSRVASTKAERITAVQQMSAHGWSASGIADRLHIGERSVFRYRAALHHAKTGAG